MEHVSAGPEAAGQGVAEAFASYLAGRTEALAQMVESLTPLLWHVARSHGCARDGAEDVVQTAWMRLIDHAEEIRDPEAVVGWLVVAVKREAWRHSRRDRQTEHDETGTVDPGATDPGPEVLAVLTEQQRLLWEHVHALPERCHRLLRVVAFWHRPDYEQVSAALGMPRGSIGPTRGRCLDKLRTALTNDPRWGGRG